MNKHKKYSKRAISNTQIIRIYVYLNKHKKYSNKAMRNSQPRNFLATINPRVLGGPRPSEKLTWRVPIPPNLALPSAVFALKEDFLDLMHGKHYSSIAAT